MVKSLNILISGRVQGVFFRVTAKKLADSLNLKGFTENKAEPFSFGNKEGGSVYIEIEGEEEKIVQFLEWCKVGPKNAEVENVEVNEQSKKNFNSFEIY